MRRVVLLMVAALATAVPVAAEPFLYSFTNRQPCNPLGCGGARLVITDVQTGNVVNGDDPDLVAAGDGVASALTVSVDGRRAYLSVPRLPGGIDGRVLVINTATNRVIASIPMTAVPWTMVPSPDGRYVYGASPIGEVVATIETATNQVTLRHFDTAFAMGLSADGSLLAVASTLQSVVNLVDTSTWTIKRTVTVPAYPQRLGMSASGKYVYVTCFSAQPGSVGGGQIVTIDTQTGAVTSLAAGGFYPARILPFPDDSKAYVTFGTAGAWGVLSATGVLTVHPDSAAAGGVLTASPDWSHAYIEGTNGVLVIDTATDTVERIVSAGSGPNLVASTACSFTLPPQNAVFGPGGGSGSVTIPAPPGCEWAVQNATTPAGLTFTSATSGVGPGVLSYSMAASTQPKLASIRIAAQITNVSINVPYLHIDAPGNGATVQQPFTIGGWAIEHAVAPSGSGIEVVDAWAFPADGSTPVLLGAVQPAGTRSDIAGIFGTSYAKSGFNLRAPWIKPGHYYLAVYGRNASTGAFDASHVVDITVTGQSQAMALDTPGEGLVVPPGTSSIYFGGWAVDRAASTGSGVDTIDVWAFPVDGGAPKFLGSPAYGNARGDVGAYLGSAFTASGFSGLLPKPPPGTYWVAVFARSTVSGQFDQWKVVTVTIQP